MSLPLFATFRKSASTRAMRFVFAFVFLMCSVTWVAQSISAVKDNPRIPGSPAALALAAAEPQAPAPADGLDGGLVACVDASEATPVEECESDVVALVALDETHDIKLFFLREFTHLLQPVVGRLPRNRDIGAITRMSSETFRPPDLLIAAQA